MRRIGHYLFVALCLLGVILGPPGVSPAGDESGNRHTPEATYIHLTKDFYEALKEESDRGAKTYSNDLSKDYLRDISISTRFMVQTNLQILRQQEKIIELLQSHLEKKTD